MHAHASRALTSTKTWSVPGLGHAWQSAFLVVTSTVCRTDVGASATPPLHFQTARWEVDLRPGTYTIEALRPLAAHASPKPPTQPNVDGRASDSPDFSFVCNSTNPLDRKAPGYHQFGDISVRVTGSRPPGAGRETSASIHCSNLTAPCVVSTVHTQTADACAEACSNATPARCAAWSWGMPPLSTCFLLNNLTNTPIPDVNAVCGWTASWQPTSASASDLSTATATASDVTVLPASPAEFVAVEVSLKPSGLRVQRRLSTDASGDLILTFVIRNTLPQPAELGAFGLSVIADQVFTDRSLELIGTETSFADPAILGQHGYVQVVPTSGIGSVLLVLPEGNTSFEAWRMLMEDPTPRSVTFEGFYSMMAHSKGYAEAEWAAGGGPFNPATSHTIRGGENYTVAYRLTLASALDNGMVDAALLAVGRVTLTATPGFVLTPDMRNASFQLTTPPNLSVVSVAVDTAPGQSPALMFGPPTTRPNALGSISAVEGTATTTYPVTVAAHPSNPGEAATDGTRVRVKVTLSDYTTAFAHFFVVPEPAQERVRRYATTLADRNFYNDSSDVFFRAPSFLNVDARDSSGVILQNDLAWIAGLSDEAGAGPGVGMAVKSTFDPTPHEVALLAAYVDGTLWGTEAARVRNATVQQSDYGVRASMFFSGLNGFNYTCHPCWDQPRSLTTWRSYNYPHVTVVYWALYRLARQYGGDSGGGGDAVHHDKSGGIHIGLPGLKDWAWYLGQAANTTLLGVATHGTYNQFGLMVESIWATLLDDLAHEASLDPAGPWATYAKGIDAFARPRAVAWSKLPFPFGSEMPWDSTGQEGCYVWTSRYNLTATATATLRAVLAYSPRVANWAYRGNARRYFDFGSWSGALCRGTEREFHHYGAPLNAIVTLTAYRADPDNHHLLEVGVAGITGTLTNIRGTGVASMAWHGSPANMVHDPYDFDFGIGFYGHGTHSGAFLVNRSVNGDFACYMCNAVVVGSEVRLTPLDSFGRRVYLGPVGLELIAHGGRFAEVVYNPAARTAVATVVHAALLPLRNTIELATPAAGGARAPLRLQCPSGVMRSSPGRTDCVWPAGNGTQHTVTW